MGIQCSNRTEWTGTVYGLPMVYGISDATHTDAHTWARIARARLKDNQKEGSTIG